MFYQRLLSLCAEKGVRITNVIPELGMGTGNLSSWKSGNIPKADTLVKLADHFGVTVDYLLGREKEPTVKDDGLHADPPDLETEDGRIKEFIHLFQQLTDSERSLIVAQIKGILAERRKTPGA